MIERFNSIENLGNKMNIFNRVKGGEKYGIKN